MFRSKALFALLSLLVAGLAGCTPVNEVDVRFRNISFNERLRPDLRPLDPGQTQGRATLFSDAGLAAALVSPLYPAGNAIAPGDLRGLGYASTLWVPAGTRFVLSYEAVVQDPRFNGKSLGLTASADDMIVRLPLPKAQRIGLSARGLTDPVTRRVAVYLEDDAYVIENGRAALDLDEVVILGRSIVPRLLGVSELFSVVLERCTNGAPLRDPGQPPGPLTETCSRTVITRDLCEGGATANSRWPATVVRCVLPPSLTPAADTSYRLLAVSAADPARPLTDRFPDTTMTPLALLDVKVVGEAERVLGRRAVAAPEECRMPDGRGGQVACDAARLAQLRLWRMCGGRLPVPQGTPLNCAGVRAGPQGFSEIASVWNVSVADPGTGGFSEQFVDGVGVRRIKIRVEDRTGATVGRYLLADEVTDLRVIQGRGNGERCEITAEERTGHAVIDPNRCRTVLRPFTVAWTQGRRNEPATWRLIQRVAAVPSVVVGRICPARGPCQDVLATNVLTRDLTIRPEDQVVFEFVVARQ